jgi:hypothetical protein
MLEDRILFIETPYIQALFMTTVDNIAKLNKSVRPNNYTTLCNASLGDTTFKSSYRAKPDR